MSETPSLPAPVGAPGEDTARRDDHAALHAAFRWRVPPAFSLAEACCARWARDAATAGRIAVRHEHEGGARGTLSYGQLHAAAGRLSHALARLGVGPGERVALALPQRPETAIAHIAVNQLGAVAVPLSQLFGPDALQYRLADSGAAVALADENTIANVRAARADCPALRCVLAVGGAEGQGDLDWSAALARESAVYSARPLRADDPALLIYTSGTTGPAKGALIPQRALLGNLPGFVCSQNWLDEDCGTTLGGLLDPAGPRGVPAGAVFWSPADWAWTGGLMDALLPSLYFGLTVVAYQGRFSPERAFGLMERHAVTHTFLFPTALKAMMKAVPQPRAHYRLALRAVMSAGEAVGDAVFGWCEQELGLQLNEMFGQTEINYVVGNCSARWPARAGSMGRAYPGHRVAVIDEAGAVCPPGTPGDVAVHRRDAHGDADPVFFLGYWGREDATRAKFSGDPDDSWCRTGDTALMDADGYLWYQGRSDDVFKAAGYRIGPGEVENCLVKHPAVANAAVVPKPDAERGALVKAYVVLAPGHAPGEALVEELQRHVRGRLAPYEYPKEIEFIDALPMTATGKVQRRVLRLQEEERAARR